MTRNDANQGPSRRRVLLAAAWAAPAVLVATSAPAAATSVVTFAFVGASVAVVHSGNSDVATITLNLPNGVSLTGVSIVVNWTPGNGSGVGAAVTAPGTTWTPTSSTSPSATFATGSTIVPGVALTVTLTKAAAGSAFQFVLSGFANGSPTLSSVVLSGNVS